MRETTLRNCGMRAIVSWGLPEQGDVTISGEIGGGFPVKIIAMVVYLERVIYS